MLSQPIFTLIGSSAFIRNVRSLALWCRLGIFICLLCVLHCEIQKKKKSMILNSDSFSIIKADRPARSDNAVKLIWQPFFFFSNFILSNLTIMSQTRKIKIALLTV